MSRLIMAIVALSLLACTKDPHVEAPKAEAASPTPVVAPAPPADMTAHFALRVRARAAYEAKDWVTCEQNYRLSASMTPWRQSISHDYYNAACCAAQRGALPDAFDALGKSVDAGFANAPHLDNDSDLLALHDEPGWAPIMARVEALTEVRGANTHQRLLGLYRENQADLAGEAEDTAKRSEARRAEVAEIIMSGRALSSEDLYHAALVYLSGPTPEDLQRAHELANRSVEKDPNNAKSLWLSAAAFDRKAMISGEPQRYGTQFEINEETGLWSIYKLDPAVTDEERAALNVPPLALARETVAAMNAAPSPE